MTAVSRKEIFQGSVDGGYLSLETASGFGGDNGPVTLVYEIAPCFPASVEVLPGCGEEARCPFFAIDGACRMMAAEVLFLKKDPL